MKYIFIGGLTPSDVYANDIENSKSPLQWAAEGFQQAFVDGLIESTNSNIDIITAPFFASWPNGHKNPYIRSREVGQKSSKVYGVGYLNLPIVKNIFKYFNIRSSLNERVQGINKKDVIVFIYSLNLAYVASAVGLVKKGCKVGVIITDLPEYPADCSVWYKLYLRYIEKTIIAFLLPRLSFYINLTDGIADAINIEKSKSIVLEGLYNDKYEENLSLQPKFKESDKTIILYTGTLDERYGVVRLVEAFMSMLNSSVVLWICGGGNGESFVRDAALKNNNIQFLGYKSKKEIYDLQRSADLLINPRDNTGLYNKYSFPSKTMEYMASGTPVLMYRLDGVPAEYYSFLYTVNEQSEECLMDAILRIISLPAEERMRMGLAARQFIIDNKNAKQQIDRVLSFLSTV